MTALPVLVVEDDLDIRQVVEVVLGDEGYDVTLAATLAEGLALVDARTYAFILTDLFRRTDTGSLDPLSQVRELLKRAKPTPVGLMTAWPVSEAAVLAEGFACLARKPFDLDALLTCVASAVHVPLTPEQEEQARVVHALFAAIGAGDVATLNALCADDIHYAAPQADHPELVIDGRAEYVAFVEARRATFPGLHFGDVRVYAMPRRMAARYEMWWRGANGKEVSHSGAALLQIADDRHICQIGIDYNAARLQQLAGGSSR